MKSRIRQRSNMALRLAFFGFCSLLQAIHAFSPAAISNQRPVSRETTHLFMAQGDDLPSKTYPPLSEDETRKLLDTIPVYAVRDSSDETKDGIVLLKEKGNDNSLAYFFFSAEMANEVYAPLRAQNSEAIWDVTAFPLGLIWYELLNNPVQTDSEEATPWIVNGIEYRLAAIPQEVEAAKTVIQQDASAAKLPERFIPLFVNDSLRLQGTDGEARVPLYLSLQDLLRTCQQATEADTESEFSAAVSLTDLCTIISQIQQPSTTNFRQAMFIPPSAPSAPSSSEAQQKPQMKVESPEDLDLPMATPDLWAD